MKPPASRRKANRLAGHNYREPGAYFVTLCVNGGTIRFGDVIEGEVVLNPVGRMVLSEWLALAETVAGIALDASILMPDHLHGIVVLGADPEVPTWPPLGTVVSRFKGMSTNRYLAKVRVGTWPTIERRLWQQGYYDRIIRNARELERIREYIAGNPARWEERRSKHRQTDCP